MALALCFAALPVIAQTARVQVIHNSPYAAAASVDVYINDELALDDFGFRDATEFIDLPAGVAVKLDVTAPNASDNSSPVFTKTIDAPGLTEGETYVLVAAGDPLLGIDQPAFDIFINAMGREAAATSGNAEFLVFHGAPDAPAVDVVARGAGTLVDDIAFGEFAIDYASVPPAAYDIDIMTADGSATAYAAVADLNGAADAALVVLASGFLNPPAEDDPTFGLLAVFPDGTTALLSANTAQVQIIHNSPYEAAGVVDVWVNDKLALDDFAFQAATEFLTFPAGTTAETAPDIVIDITGSDAIDNSSPVFSKTLNLISGERYIATAAGDPLGGEPAFDLFIQSGATSTAAPGEVGVLVFHGAPDAPVVDVTALGSPRPLVDDFAFGEYQGYLNLPIGDYTLNITLSDDNDGVVASHLAPLETLGLEENAITVLASGFLAPGIEDPAFGLIAVTSAGAVVPLEASITARVQVIHNSADPGAASVDIYVSNTNGQIARLEDVAFRMATGFLDLPAGDVTIDIAPPTSADVSESIFQKTLTLNAGETYVVVASGSLAAEDETAFDLFASYGREQAALESGADLLIFHGVTDAPAVDVIVPADTPVTLADDAPFGGFVPYQSVPLADYPLNIWTGDQTTLVAQFEAPLATLNLADEALVVLASGFLAPGEGDPAFGLYAALSTGGELVPLTVLSGVSNEDLMGEIPGRFMLHGNYPNPFNPSTTVQFDLPVAASVSINVFDMLGRQVMSVPAQYLAAGPTQRIQIDASALASGLYLYHVTATAETATFTSTGRMTLVK